MNYYVLSVPGEKLEVPMESCTAVVIDVLRATSCMAAMLASGAEEIRPFEQIQEVHAYLESVPESERARYVLTGERGGILIPGFDHGNSPKWN